MDIVARFNVTHCYVTCVASWFIEKGNNLSMQRSTRRDLFKKGKGRDLGGGGGGYGSCFDNTIQVEL